MRLEIHERLKLRELACKERMLADLRVSLANLPAHSKGGQISGLDIYQKPESRYGLSEGDQA
jgi:hypothetical protein